MFVPGPSDPGLRDALPRPPIAGCQFFFLVVCLEGGVMGGGVAHKWNK